MKFFKPKFWDKNKISLYSIILFPLSIFVKFLSFLKIFLTKTNNFKIPIICVGNIYIGGTGKTPLCNKLFLIFKTLKKNPVFIRKKYDHIQDEVAMQEKIGPVYQDKKRLVAINNAIKNNADVAILDDGFQDSSIKKDLSIVCFNEKQWLGNGLTIPSGPLRESLSALKRAHYVFINGKKNQDIEKKLLNVNQKIKIFYFKYNLKKPEKLDKNNIIAFAGIGNPINFFNLLKNNNLNIVESLDFPDHYNYSEKELESLVYKAKSENAILLTTEKDYFRINEKYRKNISFIEIDIEIDNESKFIKELEKAL